MKALVRILIAIAALLLSTCAPAQTREAPARDAEQAMARATQFFRSIATEGGYLWRYSLDLKTRAGEGAATETQIWVQPPGTPSVGQAFLRAWRVTRDQSYLEAARAAAMALVRGQLESGGWDYRIEFDPKERPKWNYRGANTGGRNISTLDDDNTQSALRLMMDVHAAQPDPRLKEAIEYGLASLLRVQYPNGAFPQRYPPPKEGYYGFYTFNDNTIADTVDTLLAAWRHYDDRRYLEAVRKAGDFMVLAQRPEPQPVWAQQYDLEMKPAWARKFEPPSVCSAESAGVLRCLITIWRATGDQKYLKPIPPAIAWFKRSQIGPNRWARFYELETNRPLYFTRKYELVYTDNDLPTHYSFQSSFRIPETIAEAEEVLRTKRAAPPPARDVEERARGVIASLDEQGRWVSNGWIESRAFVQNMNLLAEYLESRRSKDNTKSPSRKVR